MSEQRLERLRNLVREVPDFPTPGILFRDITPVLADPEAFRQAVAALAERVPQPVDLVAGIESRGFILGSAVALSIRAGFVPIRKAGKLPAETLRASYSLEYGEAIVEIHADAVRPGQSVIIVDDLIATGGTAAAAVSLIERLGGRVAGGAVLIELTALGGAEKLQGHPFSSILQF